MRTLNALVALAFAVTFSVNLLNAHAVMSPRVEVRLTAPSPIEAEGDEKQQPKDDKKKDKKGGEEDEEELFPSDAGQALELVDPGSLELAARLAAGSR